MAEDNNDEIKESSNNTTENSTEIEEVIQNETTEDQNDSLDEVESEEIKLLEEKEHFELEYFSKDEVLEKVKTIEKELAEVKTTAKKLREENDESKKKYMHLQAEFENAQKRWNKSRLDLKSQYTASVLKNFLSLYDSFKKALDSDNESEKDILSGFYSQFMSVFKSYGAEPIEVKINDLFDYSKHEALTSVEREDVPENSILEIIQDGWKYGKEVIRYTKVVISRKPKPLEPEPKEEEIEETKETKEEPETPEEEKTEKKQEKEKRKEKKEKKHKEEKKSENSE
ncbi:MAG: nucleotide exchange factor GrpE [Candidatus Lokiarchaeota archaeon]|nr:nucleotide exchange factor GrpE [Candidatus Lokiarchaeota archaeon]